MEWTQYRDAKIVSCSYNYTATSIEDAEHITYTQEIPRDLLGLIVKQGHALDVREAVKNLNDVFGKILEYDRDNDEPVL